MNRFWYLQKYLYLGNLSAAQMATQCFYLSKTLTDKHCSKPSKSMYIPGSGGNLNTSLMESRYYFSDIFVELNFSSIAVGSTTFTAHNNYHSGNVNYAHKH